VAAGAGCRVNWYERNVDWITVGIALSIPFVLPWLLSMKAVTCKMFGCVPVGGVSP
jgi:hypothetical protein